MLNKDYREMLCALNDAGAEYLLVGAFALAAHGQVRATKDIDIWVCPSGENAERVWSALVKFGAPRSKIHASDFAVEGTIYQIGVSPRRIDILTSVSGVNFREAWANRQMAPLDGLMVPVISRVQLLANKLAAGRPQDLVDAAWLQSHINDG